MAYGRLWYWWDPESLYLLLRLFQQVFSRVRFYCNEREFQIHGIVRRYSDVTGVSHDGSYFLIEMRKEYLIYLPLLVGSKFRILTKQKQLYS